MTQYFWQYSVHICVYKLDLNEKDPLPSNKYITGFFPCENVIVLQKDFVRVPHDHPELKPVNDQNIFKILNTHLYFAEEFHQVLPTSLASSVKYRERVPPQAYPSGTCPPTTQSFPTSEALIFINGSLTAFH